MTDETTPNPAPASTPTPPPTRKSKRARGDVRPGIIEELKASRKIAAAALDARYASALSGVDLDAAIPCGEHFDRRARELRQSPSVESRELAGLLPSLERVNSLHELQDA